MARHILTVALVAALAGLAGCQPRPSGETQNAPALQNTSPAGPATPLNPANLAIPATLPSTAVADIGTADLLPLKTQSWASQAEAFMSQRARRQPESVADAIHPGDFRIGPPQPAPTLPPRKSEPAIVSVPLAKPTVDQSPSSANQGGAIMAAQSQSPGGTAGGIGANTGSARLLADSAMRPASVGGDPAGVLDAAIPRQLNDNPRDLWAHLDFQLLQFLKDKPTPQMDLLARLSTEDRELIAAVMDGLTNFRNGLRADGNMLMSKKVRPLLDMADRVRVQADLAIPTMALCTQVDGFGVYEPIDPPRFVAMKEHPIIIYCEVENFASHLNDKRQWETQLSQEVVLYTETGMPVWQAKTEKVPDLAKRRRHDFFIIKKARFPANIAVGRYLLKVSITDQQASRVAEATIPVQFVAQ